MHNKSTSARTAGLDASVHKNGLQVQAALQFIKEKIMKILIIRHADPDYVKDSLTQKGWREAQYLSERL